MGFRMRQTDRTLVIYAFSDLSDIHQENLRFFIEQGLYEESSIDYIFVVNGNCTMCDEIPSDMPNVNVIMRENTCFDFGAWGVALDSVPNHESIYKYFIFMNGSVRGPFMLSYLPKDTLWPSLFTRQLKDDRILVGALVTCYFHPVYVSSSVLCMGHQALAIAKEIDAFSCKESKRAAITTGEWALSDAVRNRGYNFGSLLLSQQGVDWRDVNNHKCYGGFDPTLEGINDQPLSPVEIVFVKVHKMRSSHLALVERYSKWARLSGNKDAARLAFEEPLPPFLEEFECDPFVEWDCPYEEKFETVGGRENLQVSYYDFDVYGDPTNETIAKRPDDWVPLNTQRARELAASKANRTEKLPIPELAQRIHDKKLADQRKEMVEDQKTGRKTHTSK